MPFSRMMRFPVAALALAALLGSMACERSRVAREARYRYDRAAALDKFCEPDRPSAPPAQDPDR